MIYMLKNLRQISWRLDRLLLSRNSFQTLHQFQQDAQSLRSKPKRERTGGENFPKKGKILSSNTSSCGFSLTICHEQ
ncbi:hypothetical protein NC651_039178 [Populus alba x Populus x berolinensis]|nr:hypothetical protein NC651_039178 [Populus alba x Populus x berolinensis]